MPMKKIATCQEVAKSVLKMSEATFHLPPCFFQKVPYLSCRNPQRTQITNFLIGLIPCLAQAQSTFGCIVCHFVAFSKASATRSGDASSYKPPVNIIARGRLGVPGKPEGTHKVGATPLF